MEAAFTQVADQIAEAGYEPVWCLTDTGETAEDQVRKALRVEKPDVVLIGAGVRTDPDHFQLFELVINAVHEEAPRAKIVFNTNPFDSVEAVERGLV